MKKSFKGGMDALLGDKESKPKSKRGRPKTNFKQIDKTSEQGTKVGETRATFIISNDSLEKLKALAYWKRLSIKDVLATAVSEYLNHEKRELPKALDAFSNKKSA